MAFADPTSTDSGTNAAATNHTVGLPVLQTGDLLMVFFCVNSNTTSTYPVGWTELLDAPFTVDQASGSIAYRQVDGTEGYTGDGSDTITVVTSNSRLASWISHRYVGAADPAVQAPTLDTTTGSDANPNPPSHTPGSTEDYLWIAVSFNDDDDAISGYPAGFGLVNLTAAGVGGTAVGIATAGLKDNAAVKNPGTFTLAASEQWMGTTVAIWPAAGSPTITLLGA